MLKNIHKYQKTCCIYFFLFLIYKNILPKEIFGFICPGLVNHDLSLVKHFTVIDLIWLNRLSGCLN